MSTDAHTRSSPVAPQAGTVSPVQPARRHISPMPNKPQAVFVRVHRDVSVPSQSQSKDREPGPQSASPGQYPTGEKAIWSGLMDAAAAPTSSQSIRPSARGGM